MDRNLGFFEAWRAKKKEKKNEELERLSATRVETGVLSKYLKMRNADMVGNVKGLNGVLGGSMAEAESLREKEKKVKNTTSGSFEGKTLPLVEHKTSSATVSQCDLGSSAVTASVSSRRPSFLESNICRSSLVSPFTNTQERILTLSEEPDDFDSRKSVKVGKINEEALAIGKQFSEDKGESVKNLPKISSNLQSKLIKFGVTAPASANKKTSTESGNQKIFVKKKATVVETAAALKVVESRSFNTVQEEKIKKITNESVKSRERSAVEEKLSNETEVNDSNISVIKTSEEKVKAKNGKFLKKEENINSAQNSTKKLAVPKLETETINNVQQNQISRLELFKNSERDVKAEPSPWASDVEVSKANGSAKAKGEMETKKLASQKKRISGETKPEEASDPWYDNDEKEKPKPPIQKSASKKESQKRAGENITTKTQPTTESAAKKNFETEAVKFELQRKPFKRETDGCKKAVSKSEHPKINFQKDVLKVNEKSKAEPVSEITKGDIKNGAGNKASIEFKVKNPCLDSAEESGKTMQNTETQNEMKKITSEKPEDETITEEENTLRTEPLKTEVFQPDLIEEMVKFQEKMTMLTNLSDEIPLESLKPRKQSEASCISQGSRSESSSLRKDPKKFENKLKSKSISNEWYPKTPKLLTRKPMNEYEQAKFEESKMESVVDPAKVKNFLKENLTPLSPKGEKELVKTLEAVVEEISTSTSEKSNHEKPSKVGYTKPEEVIRGVVSIKPSAKEEMDGLLAITLVPAFGSKQSIFEKEKCGSESANMAPDPPEVKETEDWGGRYFFPVSDFSDDSYDHYVASVDYSSDSSYCRYRSLRSSSTPRRIFPQIARPSPFRNDRKKEESPVIFDAGLSFDIGLNHTALRHRFKPKPAFTDVKTNSNSLSLRISDFLKRTDHVMEEWKALGKGGEDLLSLVRLPSSSFSGRTYAASKSATNIMIKGLLNYSKGNKTPSLRSRSLAKASEASDRTISDVDELSEMTLDLSEERATGTMQAERLEAETAERVRLEQELTQAQNEKKNLQQISERLEMELFYARADVNGLSESEADLEDGSGDAAFYKNKCERAMKELEFTRRRLQQQHEDDLEQLVALKKQLEKKLADAYEEVEEQRQVAAQWKRKVQKFQSETNDLRLLLEEQSSRNTLLEKKQRKFDSEIQMLQEEFRSERNQKERLSREKEIAVAEKYSLEQNLSSVRLELELKEEKVSALSREVDELSRGGGTEQEVTQLRKAKHDLEMKLKEQEEELDEMAGQVSMLEGNKLRLEMSLESVRKEHRREMAQRDDELDEVRANAQKKIKVLESQLENEHEERTLLVREKHELERRLADAEERGRHHRSADEDALQRARRDLKKTKALLRDAHVMLERAKLDSPSKATLRTLKNQLEDAELARASVVKAKQSLEAELNEVTGQLEEALRTKGDTENRCQAAVKEINSLRTQVDENEEELAELLKKYRQTVQQLSAEQLASQETAGALAEAEAERTSLRDQLAELTARLEASAAVDPISGVAQKKLEIRIKELESRLELELTTRGRLEIQIARLKENVERLNEECVQARTKEQTATDLTRKLQRSLREVKEELAAQQAKEQEAIQKRKELEKRLETVEVEASTARSDLRLAVKRIEDLQSAISGEIGSDSERTDSDEEDSENESLVSPSTVSSASRTSRTPELTPR